MLLTSIYIFSSGPMFSFPLSIWPSVELLSHMVTQYLTFGGTDCFLKGHQFTLTLGVYKESILNTSSSTLIIFFSITILVQVMWYLMANNVEYLYMCLLATCISSLEKRLHKSFSHFIYLLTYLNMEHFMNFRVNLA